MRVKLCKTIGDPKPQILDNINLVIIEDEASGSPVSVACEYRDGGSREISFSDVTDDEFTDMLRTLGIPKICICEKLNFGKDQ